MDIEIGINIEGKIYLHPFDDKEQVIPFETKRIEAVEECENGSMITYRDMISAFRSDISLVNFIVTESVDDIMKAIKDCEYYRTEGLRHIESLLEGE